MRFSFPRRGHLAAICTGIVIAAGCSSSSPPAQAFVYGTISASSGGSCAGIGGMQAFLEVGDMGTTADIMANRVVDGGANHISCSVKGGGSAFSIALSATNQSTLAGMGGSMSLTGNNISPPGTGGGGGGTNLTGLFVGTDVTQGEYSSTNCTLTYTTPEGAGGIEPGRVWAHVECDGATNGNVTVTGGAASTCDIVVDFVFENCGS